MPIDQEIADTEKKLAKAKEMGLAGEVKKLEALRTARKLTGSRRRRGHDVDSPSI